MRLIIFFKIVGVHAGAKDIPKSVRGLEFANEILRVNSQEHLDEKLRLFSARVIDKFNLPINPVTSYSWDKGHPFEIPTRALSQNESDESSTLIQLDEVNPIHRQTHTGVYAFTDPHLPHEVIKFYSYCYDRWNDPIDPMVVENYFMEHLGPLGLSPNVYYLSPPIKLVRSHFWSRIKYERFMDGKIPNVSCTRRDGSKVLGVVRYMIMERVGKSVYAQMMTYNDPLKPANRGRLPFRDAIRYGVRMIHLLKILHGVDIIHGDAHMGNFASRLDDPSELMMIDFGRARIIGPVEVQNVDVSKFCTYKNFIHPYTGKWEMRSCKPAFRDDVYRVIQGVAMIMHGRNHYRCLESLIEQKRYHFLYMRIKNDADFWTIQSCNLHIINLLPHEAKPNLDIIYPLLMDISREASLDVPKNPYRKPNYGLIIDKFKEILNFVPK